MITYSALCCILFCVQDLSGQGIRFRTPQEAVRYYEDLVGNLTRQVRSMQDENAVALSTLRDLQKKYQRLEEDQKELRGELQALRKQVSADAESRRTQFNALADKLMKQPGSAVSPSPGKKSTGVQPSRGRQSGASGGAEEEFIEHTVEAGNTLSALARAYKVSVKEIERVNKIRKGRIYAGQKLLIPVSKKNE